MLGFPENVYSTFQRRWVTEGMCELSQHEKVKVPSRTSGRGQFTGRRNKHCKPLPLTCGCVPLQPPRLRHNSGSGLDPVRREKVRFFCIR